MSKNEISRLSQILEFTTVSGRSNFTPEDKWQLVKRALEKGYCTDYFFKEKDSDITAADAEKIFDNIINDSSIEQNIKTQYLYNLFDSKTFREKLSASFTGNVIVELALKEEKEFIHIIFNSSLIENLNQKATVKVLTRASEYSKSLSKEMLSSSVFKNKIVEVLKDTKDEDLYFTLQRSNNLFIDFYYRNFSRKIDEIIKSKTSSSQEFFSEICKSSSPYVKLVLAQENAEPLLHDLREKLANNSKGNLDELVVKLNPEAVPLIFTDDQITNTIIEKLHELITHQNAKKTKFFLENIKEELAAVLAKHEVIQDVLISYLKEAQDVEYFLKNAVESGKKSLITIAVNYESIIELFTTIPELIDLAVESKQYQILDFLIKENKIVYTDTEVSKSEVEYAFQRALASKDKLALSILAEEVFRSDFFNYINGDKTYKPMLKDYYCELANYPKVMDEVQKSVSNGTQIVKVQNCEVIHSFGEIKNNPDLIYEENKHLKKIKCIEIPSLSADPKEKVAVYTNHKLVNEYGESVLLSSALLLFAIYRFSQYYKVSNMEWKSYAQNFLLANPTTTLKYSECQSKDAQLKLIEAGTYGALAILKTPYLSKYMDEIISSKVIYLAPLTDIIFTKTSLNPYTQQYATWTLLPQHIAKINTATAVLSSFVSGVKIADHLFNGEFSAKDKVINTVIEILPTALNVAFSITTASIEQGSKLGLVGISAAIGFTLSAAANFYSLSDDHVSTIGVVGVNNGNEF